MISVHLIEESGAKDYNVYSIENTNKKSGNWKKKMYAVKAQNNKEKDL